jgi:hypothetical protein
MDALPKKAAERYADQTLALHQVLGLLSMSLIDPTKRPDAVEEAVGILQRTLQPLRYVPVKALPGDVDGKERRAERMKEYRRRNPEKYDAIKREAKIKRRMDAGMTRTMAEAHADSGSRLSPAGQDFDADDFDPAAEVDPIMDIDIPDVTITKLRGTRRADTPGQPA